MADILIVDDDADLAATVGEVLTALAHVVRCVPDGEAALDAMGARLPDAIVLDVEMPVLDGPGLAARLVALDSGKERIPIVLSSGYGDLARVAARLGTPYVLAKPYSADRLATLVGRALAERIAPAPPAGAERPGDPALERGATSVLDRVKGAG